MQIIAHSVGGIITLVVQNRRPDLIDRVVFAGVPFRGGLGYLDNLYLGTPIWREYKLAFTGSHFLPSRRVNRFTPPARARKQDARGRRIRQSTRYRFSGHRCMAEKRLWPICSQNKSWGGEKHKAFLAGTLARIRSFRKRCSQINQSLTRVLL